MPYRLRPIELLTLLHIVLSLVLLIAGWNKVAEPRSQLLTFILIALIVIIMSRIGNKGKLLEILRDWYPIFIWSFFFAAATQMNRIFVTDYLDRFFQHVDYVIFGYQPARIWGTRYSSFFLQEFFHFAYFSFYVMIPGLGLYYYWKDRANFYRYLFMVACVFYACYLTYYFLPVIGGRYWPENLALTKIYRFGVFTRLMALVYNYTSHWGGAVPSSHVAVAVAVTLSAWNTSRMAGIIFAILSFFLSISTVYCHYHYFIDVPAGILFGVVFYFSGTRFYGLIKKYV